MPRLPWLQGLSQAEHRGDKDWESIGVNAIGLLAFYNLRYDVAALCFNAVGEFRLAVSIRRRIANLFVLSVLI